MVVEQDRRPIGARSTRWAHFLTEKLARMGVTPNQVSVLSVVCAIAGAGFFVASATDDVTTRVITLIAAGACIQGRLLCNMLDGMIAVEAGKHTRTGALFNEIPDRIADACFLVGAGFAAQNGAAASHLAWAAALLAVLTAYIRAFGASQGLKQDFCGPMAKPHRMFTLTGACVLAAIESAFHLPSRILLVALIVIVVGTLVTCWRRVDHIVKGLEQE